MENKMTDTKKILLVTALLGSFILGGRIGALQGYKEGQQVSQVKSVIVGNLTGNNSRSNDVVYIQNDGTIGIFQYAPKTDYIINPGPDGAIIETKESDWQRTNIESNLVKKAFEEVTRKSYEDYKPTNRITEAKINHYTGKPLSYKN